MSHEVVVVVAGGPAPAPEAAEAVPEGAVVVAADRGLEHARALGLDVALVVGDLDSVAAASVAAAEAEGVRVERHPAVKDATDLELALDAGLALDPTRVVVLAGEGGRLDHLLSILLLLGSRRYAAVELEARLGPAAVHVVRGRRTLTGARGQLVSLLALHGPAEGIRTTGLAYPLDGETLEAGSSRGVSNVFVAQTATVSVDRGVLLAIRPGAEDHGGR